MFLPLQTEVMDRFTAVRQHFRATRYFRGDPSQTAKGLVFVEVYAIWEYTVQRAVVLAGQSISAHGHTYADLRTSLLPMFLYSDLQSLRNVNDKRVWERALNLFDRVMSEAPAVLSEPPLPSDGSHFRHTHLQLIFKVFGVRRMPTSRRSHLHRISEVVGHRNRIAHGEETAAAVGRRYSRADILRIIRQMESVCLRLIALLSEHCAAPERHCR